MPKLLRLAKYCVTCLRAWTLEYELSRFVFVLHCTSGFEEIISEEIYHVGEKRSYDIADYIGILTLKHKNYVFWIIFYSM